MRKVPASFSPPNDGPELFITILLYIDAVLSGLRRILTFMLLFSPHLTICASQSDFTLWI